MNRGGNVSGSDCTCEECVYACSKTPGWFAPGEAEKAAEFLQMPFEEFKTKHLVIDSCDNWRVGDAPYIYSPRRENDLPTEHRTAYSQRLRGRCTFLTEENRCRIHVVKPYECKMTSCGPDHPHRLRDKMEIMWIEAGAPLGMRPE